MKKILLSLQKYSLIVLFFIVLTIPSIGYSLSKSGDFKQNYYGRLKMVSTANQFRYQVLKDRMFTNLIANQNGWLMLTKDGLLDYQRNRPFTKNETRIVKGKLRGLCEFLTKENIYFVFLITPNKNTIYPEHIPPEILVMDSPSNFEVVKNVWKDTDNCKLLDIRGPLLAQKSKENVYFKTDTHWNSYGAFIGYRELMNLLSVWFPQIDPHNRSDYKIQRTNKMGDMTDDHFSGIKVSETTGRFIPREKVDSFSKKFQTKFTERDVFFTFSGNQELPSAIIYHDSFFYSMRPFIADGFRETQQFRDNIKVPSIDLEYIQQKHPDIVIVEITERFLDTLLQLPIDLPQK